MSTYAEKLRDPRWQKKRLRVMERDEFSCHDCGKKDKTLHVHHCHYVKGGPWETPSELLLTLCEDCHTARQALEEDIRRNIGIILAKTGNERDENGEYRSSLESFAISCRRIAAQEQSSPFMICWEKVTGHYQVLCKEKCERGIQSLNEITQ